MRKLISTLLLLLLLLVGGCVSFRTPIPAPVSDAATVSLREQFGPLSTAQWQRIQVIRVDGEYQASSVLSEGGGDLTLKAGTTVLELKVGFHGWPTVPHITGVQAAYLKFPVTLEAARTYKLLGEPRGSHYFVWLEDASTGLRVGNEISEPYEPARLNFIYVPIRR